MSLTYATRRALLTPNKGGGEWTPGSPVTLFFAGDSRVENGRTGLGVAKGDYQTYRYSPCHVAAYRMLGKIRTDDRSNLFATSGQVTAGWIAAHQANLVAAVTVAVNPVVIFHLATNDLGQSVPLATIQANILSIFAALRSANPRCHVLWLLENPRSGAAALSAPNEQNRKDLNVWLLAQAGLYFVPVNYLASFTADGTFDGSTAVAGYQRDGLHDADRGADVKAVSISAALNAMSPIAGATEYVGATDVYNSSTNPTGNKVINGQLAGGATTPTSWNGNVRNAADNGAATALSCTFSKPTANIARMVLGGAGTVAGESAYLQQTTVGNLAGYVAGDTLRLRAKVRWSGLQNVRAVRVRTTMYGDFFGCLIAENGQGPSPNADRTEVLEWYAVVQAANVGDRFDVKLQVTVDGNGAPTGTIDWSDVEIRKVSATPGV